MNRRDFTLYGLAASAQASIALRLFGQSAASVARGQAASKAIDPFSLVDPELLAAVKGQQLGVLNDEVVLAGQKAAAQMSATLPVVPGVNIARQSIPGPSGAPDLSIVIADTAPGQHNKPALLHIHGGGYVLGAAVAFLPGVLSYARPTGCVVVSVDYRLAPQTRFPGSLHDNYAALLWVHQHAAELGIDPARIAIAGESAGGGHAAALAIYARDRGEVPVRFQLLIYPMLDDRTGSTRAVPPPLGEIGWGAAGNRYGWAALLGLPAGSPSVPYGSVPARVEDLRGLPPAFIGVGSLDLFLDEDVEYARRLIDSAVPTELVVVPGAYHAFDLMVPDAQPSRFFHEAITKALQRAFAT